MSDALGQRMKDYEFRETERRLFTSLPIYARIDGRGFSKFTKKMERPFDIRMCDAMVDTTKALVEKTGALIGYTQSDEISLVWMASGHDKSIFFDGKIQKMASVLSGIATSAFTMAIMRYFEDSCSYLQMMPHFDARVIQLPSKTEAANMFLWRNLDATKNAISMAAHHHFSHKSLQGVNGPQMQERLFQECGINFNTYPAFFKRGTWVKRVTFETPLPEETRMRIGEKDRPERDVLITRSEIRTFDFPPFNKVENREEVIFDGAIPEIKIAS